MKYRLKYRAVLVIYESDQNGLLAVRSVLPLS